MSLAMATETDGDQHVLPPRLATRGTLGRLRVAAVHLFAERGYHGVSVREIVAAVGVKPSSLYAHYRSKEAMFSQLVLAAHEEIRDRQRQALLTAPPDPADQVRAIVRAHVAFHAHFPLLATIGDNDLHVLTGESLQRVTNVRKEAVDLLKAVVDRGCEIGTFKCREPWLAVAAIAGIGIRVAAWYRPPGYQTDDSEGYAEQVRTWMPQFNIDTITDTFADYALCLLRCPGTSPS